MAKVVFGSYMIRYPLGGMLSWGLQYLLGLRRLGHDVHLVERAAHPDACFDPVTGRMGDDANAGMKIVDALLGEHGMENAWTFVDVRGETYGRPDVRETFRSADAFVDCGTHGAWSDEAQLCGTRVLIDGEPGYTQMKWILMRRAAMHVPDYDHYYTNGCLLGDPASPAPLADHEWKPLFNPVSTDLFERPAGDSSGRYTTVMNWQSRGTVPYQGRRYGEKDREFVKFMELPRRVRPEMEIAVAGGRMPEIELRANGWRIRDGHSVTRTVEGYRNYLAGSRGEFSVCKNVYVEMWTGWFSDRSAAYLASGRPVVLQDTGFSERLPCGEGLFAVRDVEEAAAAIETIETDYARHSERAREIAREHLEATKLMGGVLDDIGLGPRSVRGSRQPIGAHHED